MGLDRRGLDELTGYLHRTAGGDHGGADDERQLGGGDRRRAAAHHRTAAGHGAAARGAAPAQELGEDRHGAGPGDGAQPDERALAPAKLGAIRAATRAVLEVAPRPTV